MRVVAFGLAPASWSRSFTGTPCHKMVTLQPSTHKSVATFWYDVKLLTTSSYVYSMVWLTRPVMVRRVGCLVYVLRSIDGNIRMLIDVLMKVLIDVRL